MLLPLGLGDLNERIGRQTVRIGQHGSGHVNLIVPCKALNHSRWSVLHRRQLCAKFGLYSCFNARDKMTQDIVEYLHLVFVQMVRVSQEKVGDFVEGC